MKLLFCSRFLIAGGLSASGFLSTAAACGPFFPTSYLSESFSEQTQLPSLGFAAELQRLAPAQTAPVAPDSETDELRRLFPRLPAFDRLSPPPEAPLEFQLYAAGARAWHAGNLPAATHAWQALLQLPSTQRHYRSVWATYMLARAAELDQPAQAQLLWAQTRALSQTGFADSEHLARASLGAEARLDLHTGGAARALQLYWQQFVARDPQAATSLQWVLRQVLLEGPAPDALALRQMAQDPSSRRIVAAWFMARGGPFQSWHHEDSARFAAWIAAVGEAAQLPPEEADQWAWAAYNAGLWNQAEHFAELAPAGAPASEWVRGLLELRAGHLETSAAHLATAARSFPTGSAEASTFEENPDVDVPERQLDGLRGAVALSRERYIEALRIFLTAGHWTDAAFVAEQVLTVAELKAYVDQEAPRAPAQEPGQDLAYLLARRLARANRYQEALPYYPAPLRPLLSSLMASLQTGYDAAQPKTARVAAFWSAAQLLKHDGMEIIGTELGPDYAVWDGSYVYPDLRSVRNERMRSRYGYERAETASGVSDALVPSFAEYERLEKNQLPTKRFHYRYRAADLAWLAAALSPDDDCQTAEILANAGNWIADRDPQSADLFYKTLALRCPHTPLGAEALQRHWLPRS